MSRQSMLSQYVAIHGSTDLMRRWDLGGNDRVILAYEIGYIANGIGNPNALYNAMRSEGYIDGGPVNNGNGTKSSGTGTRLKVRGTVPTRIAYAVAKILNIDLEDYGDITYSDWKSAIEIQGEPWIDFLFGKLGGRDSEAGKEFTLWVDSNHAIELAEADRMARESDPTFKLKEQIKKLNKLLDERDEKIADLESDLRSARIASRSANGGNVTASMKKLMQQRFHPDKQNGNDPELYNAIAQFINAIVTE